MMMSCQRCGSDDFYKNGKCAPCTLALQRLDRKLNPEKWVEHGRKSDAKRRGTPKRKASVRASNIRRYEKMTTELFNRMFEAQGGLCAVCFTEAATDIDHDHRTNKVRSLCCGRCNRALGLMRDDPDIAASACRYLTLHQGT